MSWQDDEEWMSPEQPVYWSTEDRVAGPWYAVPGDSGRPNGAWTISPRPDRPGWETDGGNESYGLPRAVAEDLARRLVATDPGASMVKRLLAAEPTLPPEIEDMTMVYTDDERAADDMDALGLHVRLARNGDWYVATGPRQAVPSRWVRVTTSGSRVPGVAPAIAEAFRAMGRTFFASDVGRRFLAKLRGEG